METQNGSFAFSFVFAVMVGLFSLINFSDHACAAWSEDPTVNTPICTGSSCQNNPTLTSDGSGGAIITWMDDRNGNGDIYAQRVDALGVTKWTADGVAICTASGNQFEYTLTSDGSGGAIVIWVDDRSGIVSCVDVYAQRIDKNGNLGKTPRGIPWLLLLLDD